MAQINGSSSKNNYGFYAVVNEIIPENYIETNCTVYEINVFIKNNGMRFNSNGWTKNIKINGETLLNYTNENINSTLGGFQDSISLFGITGDIEHNQDGTKTIHIEASISKSSYGSYDPGYCYLSGDIPLTAIPRMSSISCTDGYIESAVAININRASNSFIHNLRYVFGGLSGVIVNGVDTSYGWTIPSDFYSQIPNSQSGQCTIYCDTYNNGTLIGTSSTLFTVRTDETKCKPTLTATIEDTNSEAIALTGNKNKLIKFISNPKITINATAKNSSSISSRSVSCADGKNGSGTTVTLNKVESGNFTVSATDSRGYTTTISITKELIDYVILTLNPIFERTGPTTNKIRLDVNGNYYANSFGSTNNTLNLKYRYKELNGTYSSYKTVTATINNQDNKYSLSMELTESFDYQKQYEFEMIATDKLNSVPQNISVSKGIPIRGTFEKFFEYWGIPSFKISEDEEKLIINKDILINDTGKTFNDLIPITLYDSEAGTTGNIILSDSTKNYSYIDIYFYKSEHSSGVQRIYNPNGKIVTLYCCDLYEDTNLQELFKCIKINDKNITFLRGIFKNTIGLTNGTTNYLLEPENLLLIKKVIGYK